MEGKTELTFSEDPHPDCKASKDELKGEGYKLADNCPICEESGFLCRVGRHPTNDDLKIRTRRELLRIDAEAAERTGAFSVRQVFRYSCLLVRGRTKRKFRANLFRLAELHNGYTRENEATDGIIKAGKDIRVSLIFETRGNLNRFESEVMELMSVFAGNKRPLIDVDDAAAQHEIILRNGRTEMLAITDAMGLCRVYRTHYEHDNTNNDPDNSAECDGYSDVASLTSTFGVLANISDPEVCAQMIEDPRSDYWYSVSPEAAHIKDKAKCAKQEKNDPNNFIYMSRSLHCYFDGLNANPPKFPTMKIRYVRHDRTLVPCPSIGSDPNPLGLRPRHRVIVHIIFWSANVRKYCMVNIRGGGRDIDALTHETDLYFLDGDKAATFLTWKEAQTERAWNALRQGVAAAEIAVAEGIGREDDESDEGNG